MKLAPGQNLEIGGQPAYRVAEGGWTTPRHDFRRARKLFRNYRHQDRSLVEVDDEECLGVLIRSPVDESEGSATRLRFELDRVLNPSNAPWHPEPLERIEDLSGVVALVLADPRAARLSEAGAAEPARLAAFGSELLTMLEDLERRGLRRGALSPGDFTLSGTGRWVDLGTDLVAESTEPGADLARWAAFVRELVPGLDRPEFAPLDEWAARCLDPDPSRRPSSVAELRRGPRRGWWGR
jgi:hypothetical protein